MTPKLKTLAERLQSPVFRRYFWILAYLAVGVAYLAALLPNQQCGVGFTSMLAVGDHFYDDATDAFKEAAPRVFEDSFGYDAQFYAQIALDPTLQDPQLDKGVDTLRYRARRILMPAFAWALGGGDPASIVRVYPLINPICWFVCALLLLRWLPPTGIQNFIRWAGILLGWGWIMSTERSLTDGPAATLTVLAAFFIARNRYTSGALAIAASALAKDVSLFAGLAIFEKRPTFRSAALRFVGRGLICVTPLFLWMLYVDSVAPAQQSSFLGSGNFALPFQQIGLKLAEQWGYWTSGFFGDARFLLCFIGIATHIVFMFLRPRWSDQWWRIGISFAALAAVLGPAVWEGTPGAAPRVLLVLHIAFNLLVPKTRIWLPVLLLGNVSVIDFHRIMQPPELSVRSQLCIEQGRFLTEKDGFYASALQLTFLDGWHQVEIGGEFARKWTKDEASLELFNHSSKPLTAHLVLRLDSHYQRRTFIDWNGERVADFQHGNRLTDFPIGEIVIEPGGNALTISGDGPARQPNEEDTRRLGVSFFHLFLSPSDNER
ncbi:hypothetical protein [Pelagicoccus sp. SDUM812003]|uniref:hypothetical protein n=1 Tax=Pelagicoccus sp. SDUM812003 TaxID=3041267 RepID=UPI00280EC999|nr:hypothetical protein [Pelagicoccus sp. SDUM812003]MDQ8202321.1 hypothetical protein [Pelagicoccus sp. SDUM812003]